MPATDERYTVTYDNEGLLESKPFAAWYAIVDSVSGEEICRCLCVGGGDLPHQLAKTRVDHICDLLNENANGGIE